MNCSTKKVLNYYLLINVLIRVIAIPITFFLEFVFLNLISQQIFVINTAFYIVLYLFNKEKKNKIWLRILFRILYPLNFGLTVMGNFLIIFVLTRNSQILNPDALRGQVIPVALVFVSVVLIHVIPPAGDVASAFMFGHLLFPKSSKDLSKLYWIYFFISPALYIYAYVLLFDVNFIYSINLIFLDYIWLVPSIFSASFFFGVLLYLISKYSQTTKNR